MTSVEIDHLRQWVGRTQSESDDITPTLVDRFRATLAGHVDLPDDRLPLAIHWCLAQPAVPESETGADGHPARGGFLPPVENARRMWGGGEIEFLAPFETGDHVQRISTIASVDHKLGGSGELVIVAVDHAYHSERGLCVRERQDIVYRLNVDTEAPKTASGQKPVPISTEGEHRQAIKASTLMMFRYSALTFNGHRIHYDREYAMKEEGYPDLVFHGPLQATLLVNFASGVAGGRLPSRFTYRGVAPLFAGETFHLNANAGNDAVEAWTTNGEGRPAMKARAIFAGS